MSQRLKIDQTVKFISKYGNEVTGTIVKLGHEIYGCPELGNKFATVLGQPFPGEDMEVRCIVPIKSLKVV
jgi:hypothetical protein